MGLINDGAKYLILDASVVAAYYVPESASKFKYLADRTSALVGAVKSDRSGKRRLLVPSICIPEVFSIFAKYRFGKWNCQVYKTIDDLRYWRARLEFHNDLHNGRYLQQLELSRYHILATDLISPVDHCYEYYRQRSKKFQKRPMGAFDHTIIGMAIDLVKTRGRERVLLVTADRRMVHIMERARKIKMRSAAKLGLIKTASDLGLTFSPDIYPKAVNLATASIHTLTEYFGQWPVLVQMPEAKAKPKSAVTSAQQEDLIRLYRCVTNGTSESFTYTDEFEILYEAFIARSSLPVDRSEVWRMLSNLRKGRKLPRKHR